MGKREGERLFLCVCEGDRKINKMKEREREREREKGP